MRIGEWVVLKLGNTDPIVEYCDTHFYFGGEARVYHDSCRVDTISKEIILPLATHAVSFNIQKLN